MDSSGKESNFPLLFKPKPIEGMAYKELAIAVMINILDYNYLKQTKNYHNVFHLYEDEEKFQLTDTLEMHFMELPKLISKWRRREVRPWENELERWLLLLEDSENEEILRTLEEIAMQDPVLNQAMAAWERLSDDPKIREEYYARRKAVLDENAAVREAELSLREALQAGEKKAEEAEQKGKAEGRVEGKVEGKIEVAKNLLDMGIEILKVSKATGLTEEEVKRLID